MGTVLSVTNPWLRRRVLNYAHQGGAREAPSSTLYAMRVAVEAGADGLELDVHRTVDDHVVVCHDPTVNRTTNGSGIIAQMSLAEVQALDNAYWFVPGQIIETDAPDEAYLFRGRAPDDVELRIPTLDEVLEAFPGVFINLDIKQTAPAVTPYEHLVAEVLHRHRRVDDVIVGSFWDGVTDTFAALAPEVSTTYGMMATAAFYQAVQSGQPAPVTRHHALQVPPTYEGLTVVDERFVSRAHEHGVVVHVWTIDDAEEMEALVDLGVDGIMTDLPTVLEDVLQGRGVAYERPR